MGHNEEGGDDDNDYEYDDGDDVDDVVRPFPQGLFTPQGLRSFLSCSCSCCSYNVYNKQQTQNTSYLTDVLMWVLEEMQFEVDDVQNNFVLWCGKDVQQYIRVQSGEFLLIRLSITAHRLAGGCWGFSHKYLQFL